MQFSRVSSGHTVRDLQNKARNDYRPSKTADQTQN